MHDRVDGYYTMHVYAIPSFSIDMSSPTGTSVTSEIQEVGVVSTEAAAMAGSGCRSTFSYQCPVKSSPGDQQQ
jgi:hypothetical protein